MSTYSELLPGQETVCPVLQPGLHLCPHPLSCVLHTSPQPGQHSSWTTLPLHLRLLIRYLTTLAVQVPHYTGCTGTSHTGCTGTSLHWMYRYLTTLAVQVPHYTGCTGTSLYWLYSVQIPHHTYCTCTCSSTICQRLSTQWASASVFRASRILCSGSVVYSSWAMLCLVRILLYIEPPLLLLLLDFTFPFTSNF